MTKPEEEMFTLLETASELGVTTRTVKTYIYSGRLPGAIKGPRGWRIPKNDALKLKEEWAATSKAIIEGYKRARQKSTRPGHPRSR